MTSELALVDSLALPAGELPDEFTLSLGKYVLRNMHHLERDEFQFAVMLLGAEASKRGYLFDTYEDHTTMQLFLRFRRKP